jgi:hypothetical protein
MVRQFNAGWYGPLALVVRTLANSHRVGISKDWMRTVRGYFVTLVIAMVVPAFGLAALFLWWDSEREREAFEKDLIVRARSLSQAVKREMRNFHRCIGSVRHSDVLSEGEIERFVWHSQEAACRVSRLELGVVLTDKTGQQVFNLAAQPGQSLPNIAHYEEIRGALSGRASVSEVLVERVLSVHLVCIDVPVWIDGEVKYALGMPASIIQKILAGHPAPDGWDQKGIIAAR